MLNIGDLGVGLVLDGADGLAQEISGVTSKIDETVTIDVKADTGSAKANLEGVGEAADGVASGTAQAAGGIGDIGGALAGMGIISEGTAGSMDLVSQSIMGITGAADILNLGFEKLLPALLETKVGMLLQAAATWVATAATTALGAAMAFVTSPIGLIIIAIALLVAAIVVLYKNNETFRNFVQATWSAIQAAFEAVINWVVANLVPAFKAVFTALTAAVTTVVDFIRDHWKLLIAIIGGPLVAIVVLVTTHWNSIKSIITGAVGAIKDTVTSAFTTIKNTVDGVWTTIKNGASTAWSAIKTTVTDGVDEVVSAVTGIPGKITAVGQKFLDAGKTVMSKIFEGIKSGASAAGGFISDLASSIKSGINSALNLPFTIKGPGPLPDFTIPAFARGGIVTKPTLALIGEAGPEAVVPLSGPHRGAFAGAAGVGTNTIVVTGNNIYERVDLQTMTQYIKFMLNTTGRV